MAVLPTGIGPVTGYNVERSLRFNSADTAYLNRTPAGAGNRRTWTWSGWVKRSALGSIQAMFAVFDYASGGATNNQHGIRFTSSDTIEFWNYSGAYAGQKITTQVFRDVSAWYHVVAIWDTPNATASNRMRLYINGSEVTVFGTSSDPTQNTDGHINRAFLHTIGTFYDPDFGSPTNLLNGYLTEVNFIDGQALTPSSFGETDSNTGVWKPKAYTGTYGTNGFFLKFADNSNTTAATLGKDSSGNGNNWTPNNFSVTAGAGNDSLVDSPTAYGTDTGVGGTVRGNYCTLNPLQSGTTNLTLSNGNLSVSQGNTTSEITRGTIALPTTGKWYWEATVTSTSPSLPGIGIINIANTSAALAAGVYTYTGVASASYNNGSFVNYGATFTNGDVIGVAFDADAGTLVFYKNNSSQGTFVSSLTATYAPAIVGRQNGTGGSCDINFGQRAFAYTAPSGFKALCTQNLPTPTIGATSTTQANDYFNIKTYTGTGTQQSLTGVGFQPDFIWFKSRSAAVNHALIDAVRGRSKLLFSSLSDAEATSTTTAKDLVSFDADGFTVGVPEQNGSINNSGASLVAWNWKANGAGSSNTAGTITSTVSASTTSGFSIVTYTGTGSNATVGHGLGVAPSMVIAKVRSSAGDDWTVYHTSIGATNRVMLNLTNASAASTVWNNTAPTSSVFSVGTIGDTNRLNATIVAYCFAPVAGYSAFGSYTGNASTDGPFIYTGFRPRFVMFKNTTDNTTSWIIFDTARSTYNIMGERLDPDSSAAGSAFSSLDFLSNGFKMRANNGLNQSGNTIIYAAFAENPFKYSLAR